MLRAVGTLFDVARFRQDDPRELVMASLACPLCLRTEEVLWRLEPGDYDPSVECGCPRCKERWRVFLTPHQELRLGLMEISA
jgi:hypothetical protein